MCKRYEDTNRDNTQATLSYLHQKSGNPGMGHFVGSDLYRLRRASCEVFITIY